MTRVVWGNAVPAMVLAAGLGSTRAASLIHDYQLNGSLADSLGGPSLISNGGTLQGTGYRFEADIDWINGLGTGQGLSLENAFNEQTRSTYSIEMRFRLDTTLWWRKLMDFKNLQTENGFYNLDGCLQFDSLDKSSFVIETGRMVHMVITREDATKSFKAYVDGGLSYSFTDDADWAAFTGPNNVAWFFQDETIETGSSGLDNPTGFVDFVRVWDNPLTASEVRALYQSIPEPATATLMLLGLAGGVWWRRRGRA